MIVSTASRSPLYGAARSNVRGVRPAPGDWGIDAFVGDLAGEVASWQAKFFPDRVGDAQKEQIRESYKSAKKAASGHGYTIITWTLVLPIELSGEERSWRDKWVAAQKADKIAIEFSGDGATKSATPPGGTLRPTWVSYMTRGRRGGFGRRSTRSSLLAASATFAVLALTWLR